ncbi:phage tail protein I [Vibrio parahaemolyticus]|nr:phage tail protein I [Vibrio parahaemolyticus]ELB2030741.1 phage tail protein I [Vibrio parahaemolyticus]ELB2219756.1 phage tail protein I [Vibrio parahaemolyticus]
MSEPIDKDTLLPDNRTTFERSYEEGSKALVKSEDKLATINDPMTTTQELLPLMASERGVNDWFFSDSESEKRLITQVSYQVHQTSGTNEGIIQALDAVGYTAEITHWKQVEGGLPYTVYVLAWGNYHQTVSAERANRLIERLNHVKSERDTVELALAFGVSQSFRIQGAMAPTASIAPTSAQANMWELDVVGKVPIAIGHACGVAVHPMSLKAELNPTHLTAKFATLSAVTPSSISVTPIYTTARTT